MTTDLSNANPPSTSTLDAEGFPKIPTRISNEDPRQGLLDWTKNQPGIEERLTNLGLELALVHRQACEAYCSLGRYEEALPHQEAAVRFDPENPEYRHQLGFIRYICGDDGGAEDFEWVLAQDETNAEASFNLGMIRFGQKRYQEAEMAFARAAEHQPNDPEIWNNLGVARYQLGRIPEAVACFEKALAVDPSYEEARDNAAALRG